MTSQVQKMVTFKFNKIAPLLIFILILNLMFLHTIK